MLLELLIVNGHNIKTLYLSSNVTGFNSFEWIDPEKIRCKDDTGLYISIKKFRNLFMRICDEKCSQQNNSNFVYGFSCTKIT